ncbi:MAG: helix-turn-helix transcriptional regulator [Candidatus Dormibacteraeota bacterium]|uniref:Helix-turn-helix transcriptional regulator n=2 Tax=Candidatus Nephthysia bennettiae TaxID=3127016 RepID=A0A934K411_9BACT|nr:helix-turn-helix transcriptional regulator [Candidatus Dormibacteraeota bacterium]
MRGERSAISRWPRRIGWKLDPAGIERARVLRGWTQRELALAARVDPGTLSDALTMRRRPTLGTLQAICRSLDLTLADVIRFDNEGRA